MKLRSQDKIKAKWAVGLFSVALLLTLYNFLPSQKPGSSTPPVHEQRATTKTMAAKDIRDFALRADLIERGQFVPFNSSRNIFRMTEEITKSNPSGDRHNIETHNDGNPPSIITAAPTIDLTFFGYSRKSGEPKKIFRLLPNVAYFARNLSSLRPHPPMSS
ncbi:MAG TPA: hypothetical protein VHA33_08575 [Candidatus Angelobacter sp.]|jgi:hypothetical protein|nr:hypothetical protein [Candidatus Angelobacter sp.]